jgi:hypothetical protein
MKRLLLCLIVAVAPGLAVAQNEEPAVDMPAVDTSIPERAPPAAAPRAPGAPAAPAPRSTVPRSSGTTIVGDQEAPIGLYIMPWRQSAAATGLDRPARLLDEALMPLDPEVFRRQVEYHRALSEHLEKTGRATP